MAEIEDDQPNGFGFFTGLCIVLGVLGLLFNSTFLIMSFAPNIFPKIKEIAPAFWLSALHLTRDIGNIIGGIKTKKHMIWARHLLVICATVSLGELFYNTISDVISGELQIIPSTISFFLISALIDSSIIYYFNRPTVKSFIKSSKRNPGGVCP